MVDLKTFHICPFCKYEMKAAGMDPKNQKTLFYRCSLWIFCHVCSMIDICCHKCGRELNEPGALLFSPPIQDVMVTKYHLCRRCFEEILRML